MRVPPADLREQYEAAGQAHVWQFWDQLGSEARERLTRQLARVDLKLIRQLCDRFILAPPAEVCDEPVVEPAPVAEPEQACREIGEQLLKEGRVACLTVAGGQGTRLEFDGPKGAYPIGPVSGKSLFQLFSEQILAVQRRYGRPVLWMIMTSQANHVQTRQFFERHEWFGLDPGSVILFEQGMLPALDPAGRLILDSPGHLFESPNGHGGTLEALATHDLLTPMRERGVSVLSYAQVDNPLATLLDPLFLGHHVSAASEMSTKVVRKVDPEEKVGVLALHDGQAGLIEYSDLSDERKTAVDASGQLRFWAGNIALHAFDRSFLERLTGGGLSLPYHLAVKQVPLLGSDGEVAGTQPGHKFERFIFDALPLAERTLNLEVLREDQFGPVKNAQGSDSPAETHRLLLGLWGGWLERAGVAVPRDAEGQVSVPIEISSLYALDAEELRHKVDADLEIDGTLLLE